MAVATGLLVLYSLANLVPFSGGGAIPTAVTVVSVAVGVLGLVGAFGLWRLNWWGAIVGLVALAASAVLAVPGILFAPSNGLQALAVAAVVTCAVAIALLLLPPLAPRVRVSRSSGAPVS